MNVTCKACHVTFSLNHYCECQLCAHQQSLDHVLKVMRYYRSRKLERRLTWIMDNLRAHRVI